MFRISSAWILCLGALIGCAPVDQAPPPVVPVSVPDPVRCDIQVYCILGLWNVYSLGLYDLADELRAAGIPASAVSDSDYEKLADSIISERLATNDQRPLVLVGHSFGADDSLRVAEKLQTVGLHVNLVILLDPTSPPSVPDNVDKCINYYIPGWAGDVLPQYLAGNPIDVDPGNTHTVLLNEEVGPALDPAFSSIDYTSVWILRLGDPYDSDPSAPVSHLNIDTNPTMHKLVKVEIQKLCN